MFMTGVLCTVCGAQVYLPPVKIKNFAKHFCEKRYIKSSQFCDFWGWKHVKKKATLIKQNFALRKFKKTIFCYFQVESFL